MGVNMTLSNFAETTFKEYDHVLIIDRKGRHYLFKLERTETFRSHLGGVMHSDIIGLAHGTRVITDSGHKLLAIKPRMADYILEMPRIATVGYPKDIGAILVQGDIFPGAKVLEAGIGSGGMTIALLRAVGTTGFVTSYDIRDDMIELAIKNVEGISPSINNLSVKHGDVYEGFEEDELDRIFLDLPEPWHVVPHASEKLVNGGIFISFLPTILQVHELAKTLRNQRTFDLIEVMEVNLRMWNVGNRSVRPSHRTIGHTGFITTARRCSPSIQDQT